MFIIDWHLFFGFVPCISDWLLEYSYNTFGFVQFYCTACGSPYPPYLCDIIRFYFTCWTDDMSIPLQMVCTKKVLCRKLCQRSDYREKVILCTCSQQASYGPSSSSARQFEADMILMFWQDNVKCIKTWICWCIWCHTLPRLIAPKNP